MDTLPCQGCGGLCCGPVPITEQELKKIKKKVASMPARQRAELRDQERFFGTCMFFDLKRDKCGIYSARPRICQDFGYYRQLVCFRKPELATKPNWVQTDPPVAMLSVDITWKDFK
jgi:Fe-S-cluster containining protein